VPERLLDADPVVRFTPRVALKVDAADHSMTVFVVAVLVLQDHARMRSEADVVDRLAQDLFDFLRGNLLSDRAADGQVVDRAVIRVAGFGESRDQWGGRGG